MLLVGWPNGLFYRAVTLPFCANHHAVVLGSFNLLPQQFPMSLNQLILAGFNVTVVTWIGSVFDNVCLILSVVVAGLFIDALIRALAFGKTPGYHYCLFEVFGQYYEKSGRNG